MDKKQQQQIIITIGMIVVLIFILMNNFSKKKPKSASKISEQAISSNSESILTKPAEQSAKAASVDDIEKQKKRAQMAWGIDPFYHGSQKDVNSRSSSLVLKGVSLGKNKKFAFINDQIVTIGEKIGEYKIKEITQNRILLERGSEKFYLVLPEEQF